METDREDRAGQTNNLKTDAAGNDWMKKYEYLLRLFIDGHVDYNLNDTELFQFRPENALSRQKLLRI